MERNLIKSGSSSLLPQLDAHFQVRQITHSCVLPVRDFINEQNYAVKKCVSVYRQLQTILLLQETVSRNVDVKSCNVHLLASSFFSPYFKKIFDTSLDSVSIFTTARN